MAIMKMVWMQDEGAPPPPAPLAQIECYDVAGLSNPLQQVVNPEHRVGIKPRLGI